MSPGLVNGPSFTELPPEARSNMEKYWSAACPLKKLAGRVHQITRSSVWLPQQSLRVFEYYTWLIYYEYAYIVLIFNLTSIHTVNLTFSKNVRLSMYLLCRAERSGRRSTLLIKRHECLAHRREHSSWRGCGLPLNTVQMNMHILVFERKWIDLLELTFVVPF